MSLDNCCGNCDESCSGMDLVGVNVVSHEDIERDLDKAFRPTLREKYQRFLEEHPRIYAIVNSISATAQYF